MKPSEVPAPSPVFVSFQSTAFNTTIPKKHFISLRSYGDDLANWLMNELAQRDAAFDPTIGHEDFGWYVRFRFGGATYQLSFAYRNPDWLGKLERRRTILEWIFRAPGKGVEDEVLALIHHVLASSGIISDIWWHYREDFDAPVI
jgi:hypothetical protein